MKNKISYQLDKKPKNQYKLDDRSKDRKLRSTASSREKNKIQIQYPNLKYKFPKKNNNATDIDKGGQKINEQSHKNKSNSKTPKLTHKRIFSVSTQKEKVPEENNKNNNILRNTDNRKKPKNLSMDRNYNSSKDYFKSPNNLKIVKETKKTKKNKKKEEKKEEQTDKFTENYDPDVYGFNLYKHMKENLRNVERLCKDNLTKNSLYCLDCKLSICNKCPESNAHEGHNLVPKYLYYDTDGKVFDEAFNELDTLFQENPSYLDYQRLKEELKNNISENIEKLIKRLNEIKKKKIKELDKIFQNADDSINTLKQNESKIKNDIKEYLEKYSEKNNDFFFIKVKDGEDDDKAKKDDTNLDVIQNLSSGVNNDIGLIEINNDSYNTVFILNYDLYKNALYINNEICKLLYELRDNKEKYLKEFNDNVQQVKIDIEKLDKPFKGVFNYKYFSNDFYKMIKDKLEKYNEKIDVIRRYIYDMVNRDGNFDQIDNDIRENETHIGQRFDNILNNQITDKDDAHTVKTKSANPSKDHFHRLSMYSANLSSDKLKNKLKTLQQSSNASISSKGVNGAGKYVYPSPDDVRLDKSVLQKYFAYEAYNTVHNHFRYKKPNPEEDEDEEGISIFDEIDRVKPLAGTNEIQLYDRKTTTLTRREVEFDKKKHKYLYFLNGCRCVLVKNNLYIFGGVDQAKYPTKVSYVYNIKTNELEPLPDMLKPHAYHSVYYLDYYKAIIVLGGENSSSCELYDLNTGNWHELPDMNVPRAHCNLYLDKFNNVLYTFFGVIGDITEKNNYTDVIECLELRRLSLGWSIIDYENKAEMDFKSGFNKILPISKEMILIYGATNMRDLIKKGAIYMIPKFEIVKIDKRIFGKIKDDSPRARKLSKILSSYL